MENNYSNYKPRMKPNQPNKLNMGRTILISFSFFTVLLAWTYFNFKVPLLLDDALPDFPGKDTIRGLIMALDNIVAVLLQPLFGNMSDRTQSKFGRRMPYIFFGTVLSAICYILIPFIQILFGLILIILLFDIFMCSFRSVAIAILPDYTRDEVRSKASGIQQFVSNMGGVIAFVIPPLVAMIPNPSESLDRFLGFLIIGVLMLTMLVLQMIYIKETPTSDKIFKLAEREIEIDSNDFTVHERPLSTGEKQTKKNVYLEIKTIFKENKDMAFMLLSVTFMYLGFASLETFFSSFAIQYIGFTEGQAGTVLLAYSGPMILSAPLHGIIGQKIGRKKALIGNLILQMIAIGVWSFVYVPLSYQNPNLILAMLLLACVSIPWMGVIIQTFAVLWAISPEGEIGTYTGYYYMFNQAAYTLSPILTGAILDIFNFLGERRYLAMFPFFLVSSFIALMLFLKVKSGDEDISVDTLKEYQEAYRQDD
ncbi:MFS transporter [Candidatus Lokiarchaeum ossiferum]|uniref:MFS transporter n=1 Tax=Candidatus Lokiarchaeum ossiferum TaxID=2951803 RepID=UPI00352EF619